MEGKFFLVCDFNFFPGGEIWYLFWQFPKMEKSQKGGGFFGRGILLIFIGWAYWSDFDFYKLWNGHNLLYNGPKRGQFRKKEISWGKKSGKDKPLPSGGRARGNCVYIVKIRREKFLTRDQNFPRRRLPPHFKLNKWHCSVRSGGLVSGSATFSTRVRQC